MAEIDRTSNAATHAAHWDVKYREMVRSAWTANPFVQRAVNARMTGNPSIHWLNWLFEEFFPERPSRVLSVGCGDGGHELIIARQSYADFVYGFDASPVGVEIANQVVQKEGLNAEFAVRLFEDFANEPAGEPYDVALFAGSLHHVRDIEEMLFAIQKAVRPGGYVVINEYVGPAYQLYGERQLELVNLVLGLLPEDLIADPDFRVVTPTMRTIYESDPSEGVRAPLIPTLLPRFFRPLSVRKMGGALLHPLFDGINATAANVESERNARIFNSVLALEDLLTKQGVIDHDFMFGIFCNDLQ